MPHIKRGKVQITIYFEPEIYHKIDAHRNPCVSKAEFYSSEVKKAFGLQA